MSASGRVATCGDITSPHDTRRSLGCTLEDSSAEPHTIASSVLVAPSDHVVIGGSASDVTRDYTFPAGIFGLSDTGDLLTLRCGTAVVDTVDWQAAAPGAPFPTTADGQSLQVSPTSRTATANDMGANWCATPTGTMYGTGSALTGSPGAANPSCPAVVACTPATHLVINEIAYDDPSTDEFEFIELHNPAAASIDLAGMAVAFVNGSTDTETNRVALTGSLAAGGYAVVRTPSSSMLTTPPGVATFMLSAALQNDDEAVGLLSAAGAVIDAIAYEMPTPSITLMGGAVVTPAETTTAAGTETDGSLARTPNACDRDTPALDWASTSRRRPARRTDAGVLAERPRTGVTVPFPSAPT